MLRVESYCVLLCEMEFVTVTVFCTHARSDVKRREAVCTVIRSTKTQVVWVADPRPAETLCLDRKSITHRATAAAVLCIVRR